MKTTTDHYFYKNGEVTLDFSFQKDKHEMKKKKAFAVMLRFAAGELEKEIAADNEKS